MRPSATPLATNQLAPLTGLRFLAAFHVVLFHFRDLALAGAPAWMYEIANKGYVSVGLFFVLSGFILVHAYPGARGRGAVDRRAFWVARVARIYPVYLLSILVAAPGIRAMMLSVAGTSPAAGAVPAWMLITTLGQGWTLLTAMLWSWPSWSFAVGTLDWNFPVWSLGAEMFFYCLFPFLAPPFARLSTRTLAILLVGCWGLAVAPPLLYGALPGATYPSDHGLAAWSWVINYTPIFRLPEFVFGVVLGHLYARRSSAPPLRRWIAHAAARLVPVAAGAGLVLCLVQSNGVPGLLLANGLFDPLFGLIVYGLAISDGGLAWLLARRPALLLGEASYALYVLHIPIWDALSAACDRVMGASFDSNTRSFFAIFVLVALAIAVTVFLLWERPARSFLRFHIDRLLECVPPRRTHLRPVGVLAK